MSRAQSPSSGWVVRVRIWSFSSRHSKSGPGSGSAAPVQDSSFCRDGPLQVDSVGAPALAELRLHLGFDHCTSLRPARERQTVRRDGKQAKRWGKVRGGAQRRGHAGGSEGILGSGCRRKRRNRVAWFGILIIFPVFCVTRLGFTMRTRLRLQMAPGGKYADLQPQTPGRQPASQTDRRLRLVTRWAM